MFELKSTYFNTAYMGPMPIRTRQAIDETAKIAMDPAFKPFDYWAYGTDRVRAEFARLIKCSPVNVALSTSVSELVSHVANGLSLKEDDEVILLDGDFPSMVLPWMVLAEVRGFKIRLLDLSYFLNPDTLEKEITGKTKYVGVSHVMFNTGAKLPIAEIGAICRKADVLFLADVSQSLGGMALSNEIINNVDIMVGVGYKWLLCPNGAAFGYFSNRSLDRVRRTHGSWLASPFSNEAESLLTYTTDTPPGAARFDRGQSHAFFLCAGIEASLRLISEVGLEKIEMYNRDLVDLFFDCIPAHLEVATPREFRSNIVCVKPGGRDPRDVLADLNRQNIDVAIREGMIRISFHFFNTREQVQKLVEALG
jgi:cysteine desulfurase/selenocysteine lyase